VPFRYGFRVLKYSSYWAYRLVIWAVLAAGVAAAVTVIGLRYFLLPRIDEYREPIVRSISQAIGQTVEMGRIAGDWRGLRPSLTFFDVQVHEVGGQRTLALDRVDTVLSWRTLISGTIVFKLIEFTGPHVEIRRDSLGTLWVAGEALQRREAGARSRVMKWLFAQQEIVVRGAGVTWIDEMRSAPVLQVKDIGLRIENDGLRHRLGVTGTPPAELASDVSVNIEFFGESIEDFAGRGRLYAEFEYANLAFAREWVSLPLDMHSGLGVMRMWIDVENRAVRRVIAEANLVNVAGRLDTDVDAFELASLSGRAQWEEDVSARQVALSGLTLVTSDGLRLPPTDISIRMPRAQPSRRELRIRSLDLSPLAGMSKFLPLGAQTREKLASLQPAGVIENLTASWLAGEPALQNLALEAQFREVAANASGNIPGFSGLSGSLTLADGGGTVALNTGIAALNYPQLFAEPIPFDYLAADAGWEYADGRLRVDVRSLSFTNEHAAGKASGTYVYPGKGRGDINVRAVLVRAEVKDVWRYFPNQLANTRDWLKQGLIGGRSGDVRLQFAGPLDRFPYTDKRDGVFEVTAAVRGGTVRIGDDWPLIEGINGDFRLDRDRIDIESRKATIMGADISKTRVSILDIGKHEVRLQVDGKAAAEVGQYLRFVANSPVHRYTNGVTAGMRGQGIGALALQLELPFFEPSELAVAGHLDIAGPEFDISAAVPQLNDYAVRIEFDKSAVALRNGRAHALGGAVRFGSASDSRRKGVNDIFMVGRAEADALAAFSDLPALRQLYGDAEWEGRLDFAQSVAHLRVESTLVGLGSRLPAPLGKLESASLPVRADVWIKGKGENEYAASIENIGSARFASKGDALERGAIVFGGEARLPQEAGVSARGRLGSLDYDGWRELFAETRAGNLTAFEDRLRVLDLSVGRFLFGGRSFSQLQIAGRRIKDSWQLELAGPQVKGNLVGTSDAEGQRINARFQSLVLDANPPTVSAPVTEERRQRPQRIPAALNVVVDALQYEGKDLGRLELLAEPMEDGWRLERLAVANPDGRIDVKGHWRIAGRPHAEYAVRFESKDNGKFFKRLGYDETIVGGTGLLSGPVSWLGGPFEPDLPTLNGKLKLEAADGRFAQVDPGAAQLIGILSLQALPRRITLNFKDVFSTGFSFDRIDADVTITDGVARTDNFRMDGVAADVTMQGQVNLVTESQDLEVHVRPMLTSAAAVAGAAVVNPLVGVAALLVQKALGDPVEQAASRNYRVTGTWKDPQVARIERQPVAAETSLPGK